MISRIGTFANATALIAASLKVQAKVADQQAQQASGYKSTTFSGLSGDAAKLLDLTGQSARLTADNASANAAASMVQAAYSAVTNITDLATTIRSQLAAAISGANNGTGASAITGQSAANWLSTLQSELNTEVGGVYVFGGQASNAAPVDFTTPAYNPAGAPASPDTSYYLGSDTTRTLTTSQGVSVSLSAPASASGFEQLARALSLIAANPSDPATLQAAYDSVGTATSGLASTQAMISNQASSLDMLVTNNQAKITTLDNLASTVDGADLATATVLVTQYQTQLDALYSAIGKLSADNILKYI
ncbi:flagellar biosynthesis protein FlgL [Phenylobacterium hankyongense]|uniref:Flagellar biosynthesis protein FlgL n=1 Tax=Phenylobacterium hankyongense TaxID=1813876 RepID=A0A328AYC6_9CAUL|nr:flagellin [Phenylobacterium hankyongense]RAK59597.1 flagellar biosynthesis protein FlgL [Phenylobacterium hankyongense]